MTSSAKTHDYSWLEKKKNIQPICNIFFLFLFLQLQSRLPKIAIPKIENKWKVKFNQKKNLQIGQQLKWWVNWSASAELSVQTHTLLMLWWPFKGEIDVSISGRRRIFGRRLINAHWLSSTDWLTGRAVCKMRQTAQHWQNRTACIH